MIIPILQIRKQIAQDRTVNEVAGSDCKALGSPLQHMMSTKTFRQWEKGLWKGRVSESWEEQF